MPKVKLDDVERHLIEQTYNVPGFWSRYELMHWLRGCFAELRAREEAKVRK